MLFNSNEFLFVYLPLVLIAYHAARYLVPNTIAPIIIITIASFIFYAMSDFNHLWLLIVSVLINYCVGLKLVRTSSKLVLVTGIVFDLGVLVFFKYTSFLTQQLTDAGVMDYNFSIMLPVGVSFFTFTQIAFLVDAYKGRVSELDPIKYGLFVSYYPHLIAGPIIHHAEMMPQFRSRRQSYLLRYLAVGAFFVSFGLIKKTLIADQIASLSSPVFALANGNLPIPWFQAWTAALAFTFQIYFDFSAYSDMAIGLSLMLGIRLPANFNSPYQATSIIDFWRRWHMTLSRFLRDYLYIPLGGNRHGKVARYRNLIITMALGGIWHGAGWTFLIWGLLHGAYLVVNHGWNVLRGTRVRMPSPLARALTFLAVVIAWVPFRAESLVATRRVFEGMLGVNGLGVPIEFRWIVERAGLNFRFLNIFYFAENDRSAYYTNWGWLILAGLIAFLAPNLIQLARSYRPVIDMRELRSTWASSGSQPPKWRLTLLNGILVGAAFFVAVKIINSAEASEFLYFQF